MRTGRRYLVDIDTLFDTRLGWAKVIAPEALEKLELDAFRKRHTDIWAEAIGIQNWSEQLKQRDKRALFLSDPTEFLLGLKNQVLVDLTTLVMSSPIDRPTVTINMWPYTDLTAEQSDAFLQNFRQLYNEVKVDMVYIDHKDLSPGRLDSMWDIWYMFDWFNWVTVHAGNFAKKIPQFKIHPPALLTDGLTTEAIEAIERDGVNPFSALTRFMEELVTIDPVDARLYSILRPLNSPDEQTPQP
ncbi:putative virion structural protein [Erwinia phage Machina]|uniref:Putative virion structural protein n=2 Tax=Machinavirus machina TaxID=2169990 RepID=A0A1B2IDM9_9CAUD|nr:putative virion structural protein [Erwinia phage vB_EamM_Huxley]YP_009617149.1 putative virion structural protein [Erwinia phage Machina]ANZ49314.1 putative virion structural protein [Erwinia phage vB_EamM_Huxley]ANZ49870.1 putative virion structural protein [Erwinia phage Machina]ANZ50142.1 putative virion structural protein [Erwinia phage vB_EamM_Parshik]